VFDLPSLSFRLFFRYYLASGVSGLLGSGVDA
jgi:hypothetical protein